MNISITRHKLSIIIPCYNEEKSIERVIRSLPKEINEIIVVDNNSTDNTAAIAKRLGVRVIFEPRKGYGAALKAGFMCAKGDIIIAFDGDGQHPSKKIREMVRYLEEHNIDFLSGKRFPMKSQTNLLLRSIGNRLLTFIANILFGLNLHDSQSGMWVFRKTILSHINLEGDDMALSEEIKIKVALHPFLRFEEYTIPYYPRIGKSKLVPIRHGVNNLLFLLKLKLRHVCNHRLK